MFFVLCLDFVALSSLAMEVRSKEAENVSSQISHEKSVVQNYVEFESIPHCVWLDGTLTWWNHRGSLTWQR